MHMINAMKIDSQNFLQVSYLTQVWTSGSKIQDFQETFLGSMMEILDPEEVAGSKISTMDPRKVSWTSWILDLDS